MQSKALEINLKTSRVDVIISEKYDVLPEVMSRYQGLLEGLNVFLEELCHPFKNWQFIVKEARRYALDYLHLLKTHRRGPEAAGLYLEIFLDALGGSQDRAVKVDASDNLLLYLQTIIKDSGEQFSRYLPVINEGFDRIASSEDESFFLFVRSFYQINRLAKAFMEKAPLEPSYGPINALMLKYLQKTYAYWLSEEDPLLWFQRETGLPDDESTQIGEIFDAISHQRIKAWEERLASSVQKHKGDSRDLLSDLLMLPGYAKLVEFYGEVPQKLLEVGERIGQGNYWKLIFLFHIMNCAGLYSIHEETLREINRTLTWPISHEKTRDVELLIQKTFAILKDSAQRYPGTALNCVVTMGMAIYQTDDSELVDYFIDAVVDLGFQTPDLEGIGEDWQVKANATHIQNIRTWLELIEKNPKWSKKLLSSLTINLSLEGVFIKDTDLFPRDVTRFLNSDIGPVFNLAKQLTRLFPVYFNDIGAEGLLRDVSTKIDELTMRKDELIHFLRKQSHVESSNQIVGFMEAILDFWRTTKKEVLKPHLPPNIYGQIDPEGPYIDGMHRLTTELFKQKRLTKIGDLLEINEADVRQVAADLSGISHVDLERLVSAIALYKLLHQKYDLSSLELSEYVRQLSPGAFPEIDKLKDALAESDAREKLAGLLDYLASLKETILSPEAYEIREDIYRKRHIAVDIPSMYGSYHERKFDTLGLIFRLESLVNILFEELVNLIDLELITRDTFSHIFDYLKLFDKALKLDGILSWEMERQLDLLARSLEVRGFSFTQFLDIFRGFSLAVNNIVNDCFNNIHQLNLIKILGQLPFESLAPKYKPNNLAVDQEKHAHIVSEIFLRERIATSLGLQQLDLFLSRILTTLHQQADKLPGEGVRLLLNYEPIKAITLITDVNQKVSGLIYLGNKGLNLVRLSEQGFPVPPGFIITTETFRCREVINHYPPAEKNLKVQLARELAVLEKLSGKSFGKPENPLLLSVRSGAPISQPGMMNTFLNVGINVDIVHGIINLTKKDWFAWDCYRRFLQSYGMTFGLQRNDFDDIIGDFKNRL
ncbi:MAG: pyruvate, phosphate dikinase, partial [Proteobacteria bacterium]|nr:pyruvate, phosphate dikinase [Pseudomonadota bacterium]